MRRRRSSGSSDFGPHRLLADAQRKIPLRLPDEALYAMALYIHSLEPPPNPNRFDANAAQVWYRGHYLHDGSLTTLEKMFDPSRLRESFVPVDLKGYKVKNRAVTGHEFGLQLKQ